MASEEVAPITFPSKEGYLLAPTRYMVLELALKSPPALVEGGREKPYCTKDCARAVDDGHRGGDEAGYNDVPSCGASST
jgi:hypothetical protein